MKGKNILLIAALLLPLTEYAQTQLNKTIPVKQGQSIHMSFDYPKLVRVSTWDRNEIAVQGTVNINGGENDDAFVFEQSASGNSIGINSFIKGMKDMPQRITVIRDGKKTIFRDKSEFKKYQQEHGSGYETMSMGPDIDIQLEIMVPKNVPTLIKSVYGMVEVKDFSGPLTVQSTYGGVDAALAERTIGEIEAETNYGDIYTNFSAKFGGDGIREEDFHTYVTAKPGQGPKYSFVSKYGNVYLRKSAQ